MARFAASAASRASASACSRLHVLGDVAADALDLDTPVLIGPDHDAAPGEPARTVVRLDLFIMDASAISQHAFFALFDDRQRGVGAEQRFAALSGQRAEGVVDIGEMAVVVAPDDQVALAFQQAGRARFGFFQLPHVIGEFLTTCLGLAQILTKPAVA